MEEKKVYILQFSDELRDSLKAVRDLNDKKPSKADFLVVLFFLCVAAAVNFYQGSEINDLQERVKKLESTMKVDVSEVK